MKADWLLMKDVRDELAKLRSRWRDLTGSDMAFKAFLLDAWEAMCRTVEDERAINGGRKRYGLRREDALLPEIPSWPREFAARNYVGRPRWDIIVDRVMRRMLSERMGSTPPRGNREELEREKGLPSPLQPSSPPSSR